MDKYFRKFFSWKVNYNEEVTLYTLQERNFYMLASEDKVIDFINLNYKYDKEDFINKVYEEIFLGKR